MRTAIAAGTRASRTTTPAVATDGRAAIEPKTAARMRHVVETPSQRALKLLSMNGGRLDTAIVSTARRKAAACATPPNTKTNEEKPRRSLGARGTLVSPA